MLLSLRGFSPSWQGASGTAEQLISWEPRSRDRMPALAGFLPFLFYSF
jgi:hypothetical protein